MTVGPLLPFHAHVPQGQLTECEQQLMEKELLFEQVGKLTDRASRKVDNQRESTLTVAKKVNNYQSRIKDVTRKMMAQVSELSMQQVGSYTCMLELGVKTCVCMCGRAGGRKEGVTVKGCSTPNKKRCFPLGQTPKEGVLQYPFIPLK